MQTCVFFFFLALCKWFVINRKLELGQTFCVVIKLRSGKPAWQVQVRVPGMYSASTLSVRSWSPSRELSVSTRTLLSLDIFIGILNPKPNTLSLNIFFSIYICFLIGKMCSCIKIQKSNDLNIFKVVNTIVNFLFIFIN